MVLTVCACDLCKQKQVTRMQKIPWIIPDQTEKKVNLIKYQESDDELNKHRNVGTDPGKRLISALNFQQTL